MAVVKGLRGFQGFSGVRWRGFFGSVDEGYRILIQRGTRFISDRESGSCSYRATITKRLKLALSIEISRAEADTGNRRRMAAGTNNKNEV